MSDVFGIFFQLFSGFFDFLGSFEVFNGVSLLNILIIVILFYVIIYFIVKSDRS